MQVAVRLKAVRAALVPAAGAVVCGVLLAACASSPRYFAPVALDTPDLAFTSGRIMLLLTDENGLPMVRTRVDLSWETPQYYKTSAFTDNYGQVTFKGVPEVAELSIDHPGGNFSSTLVVPQRGMTQVPVVLDTYGENALARERLRTPIAQQTR